MRFRHPKERRFPAHSILSWALLLCASKLLYQCHQIPSLRLAKYRCHSPSLVSDRISLPTLKSRKTKSRGSLHFLGSVLVSRPGSSAPGTKGPTLGTRWGGLGAPPRRAAWPGPQRHLVFAARQLPFLHTVYCSVLSIQHAPRLTLCLSCRTLRMRKAVSGFKLSSPYGFGQLILHHLPQFP